MGKHSSQPRNKNIAFTFFKAGFIDSWGRGYKKIKEGFEDKGMKMPTVEEIDGGVKITIHRGEESCNVVKDVVKDVLNTAAPMARRMSVSVRTIQRDLEVLQKNVSLGTVL